MSGSKAFDELKTPEGWKFEHDDGSSVLATPAPEVYYASINWRDRCFRSGISSTGGRINTREYAGPGWRQILVDDAIAWLNNLLKGKR